eukprot:Opistho-2@63070
MSSTRPQHRRNLCRCCPVYFGENRRRECRLRTFFRHPFLDFARYNSEVLAAQLAPTSTPQSQQQQPQQQHPQTQVPASPARSSVQPVAPQTPSATSVSGQNAAATPDDTVRMQRELSATPVVVMPRRHDAHGGIHGSPMARSPSPPPVTRCVTALGIEGGHPLRNPHDSDGPFGRPHSQPLFPRMELDAAQDDSDGPFSAPRRPNDLNSARDDSNTRPTALLPGDSTLGDNPMMGMGVGAGAGAGAGVGMGPAGPFALTSEGPFGAPVGTLGRSPSYLYLQSMNAGHPPTDNIVLTGSADGAMLTQNATVANAITSPSSSLQGSMNRRASLVSSSGGLPVPKTNPFRQVGQSPKASPPQSSGQPGLGMASSGGMQGVSAPSSVVPIGGASGPRLSGGSVDDAEYVIIDHNFVEINSFADVLNASPKGNRMTTPAVPSGTQQACIYLCAVTQ